MKMRILKKFMKAYKAYDGRYREEFVSIMNKFAKHVKVSSLRQVSQ